MPLSPDTVISLQLPSGARAGISRRGAHVLSWIPPDGRERLFLSQTAIFAADTAIRGGVPVCFPQFSDLGALPKHGFLRTASWSDISSSSPSSAAARLGIEDSPATRQLWPYPFKVEYGVALSDRSLALSLTVHNPGPEAFEFTAALHTYLRVGSIQDVHISGLEGRPYYDQAARAQIDQPPPGPLGIEREVDRLYPDAAAELTLGEPGSTLRVNQTGFKDVVIWNPGRAKGAALADLELDGYRRFVCIEAAAASRPVEVPAGAAWVGSQTLTV